MRYFSTNGASPHVSFRDAVINGQPDDGGLYFPASIPRFPDGSIDSMNRLSNAEIAFVAIRDLVGDEIPDDALRNICEETVDFPFPLVEITPDIATLELFHGPTLAFKDVGARFMSRCLGYLTRGENRETVIIVATSGDTGGAVAAGFHGVEGVKVVILYPKDKVSRIQEQQLTTHGGNVITLEVRGAFDDCQRVAKSLLRDKDIRERVRVTSANSINVARWLPQQFYYLFGIKQWKADAPPIVCVPSGNFGNLAAGVLAHVRGMPVRRFIAACNANDVVPRYLDDGRYEPRATIATISNAMDVGDPSNFVRIERMLGDRLSNVVSAASIDDDATISTIQEVYSQCNYTLDPHAAVAFAAMKENASGEKGFILGTAHPIKFDAVADALRIETPLPASVKELDGRPKHTIETSADHHEIKETVLSVI